MLGTIKMRPLSSLAIGLSLVTGFLLLALAAELYYLLWWKNRSPPKRVDGDIEEADCTAPAKNLLYYHCWKRPPPLSSPTQHNSQQSALRSSVMVSGDGEDDEKDGFLGDADCLETELMRLYGLAGPPRLLFTITEETKEDLESEDGRSRCSGRSRGGSLRDLLLASPRFATPPLTPVRCYGQQLQGFNPLFESSMNEEVSRMRTMTISSPSPPPKFKFLKDAEEKLYRRTLMEEALRAHKNGGADAVGNANATAKQMPASASSPLPVAAAVTTPTGEDDGSFITIIIGKNREKAGHLHQLHSSSSQVIPLPSSPSNFRTTDDGI